MSTIGKSAGGPGENGFELAAIRPIATVPSDTPMAIYRLQAAATPHR